MSPQFVPGQRWISDAEVELGLGTILQCDNRAVTVLFPSNGDTRVYSTRSAPLTRVMFSEGDVITHHEGWQLTVDDSKDLDGLIAYIGEDEDGEWRELPETQLSHELSFQGPRERLLTGQLDRNNHFYLRMLTRQHQAQQVADPLRGLRGPRVGLIPHQLYIAHEVGQRLSPRVLLADEVGLGKTIEAGMILHQQLLTGRAKRALILVPESLTHQWLVELLRRFGLPVTLIDEAYLSNTPLPFEDTQIALASIDWLANSPGHQLLAGEEAWDLLIVDEAHHLKWSPESSSATYQCVETLAHQVPGLLLLTATPEQAGDAGFFGQLRLLDPQRYPSLEAFREEESHYRDIAAILAQLEQGALPDADQQATLAPLLDSDTQALLTLLANPESDEDQKASARQQLMDQLIDRYGTGRVLFRNRRASVEGFPERLPHTYPLPMPDLYDEALEHFAEPEHQDQAETLSGQAWPWPALTPERLFSQHLPEAERWWQLDPRVDWLQKTLKESPQDKFLVICQHAETALELAEGLRVRSGLLAAVFHEDMALIERDRAAAWFADDEDGAQLLICSEIGSEGRNFQFAHHLVLFDLPPHPDLLEQRIGRLDRIGQQHTIQIHVPYLEDSAQSAWLEFCHAGLDQLRAPRPVGGPLFEQFEDDLEGWLNGELSGEDVLAELIPARLAAEEALEAGRHRLLELASHRPDVSESLVAQLEAEDADDSALQDYLERALDVYRLNNENLDEHTWHLRPSNETEGALLTDVHIDYEEGSSATFLRDKALVRDDLMYLTWEHPLVRNCMDAVTGSGRGNSCVALLKNKALPAGTLLLELLFVLEGAPQEGLDLPRHLPPHTLRLLLDANGNNLGPKVSFKGLSKQVVKMKKGMARQVVKLRQDSLRQLFDQAEQQAQAYLPSMIEQAQEKMQGTLDPELTRLRALAKRNPAVREAEIEQLASLRQRLGDALNHAQLRLDAARLLVSTTDDVR